MIYYDALHSFCILTFRSHVQGRVEQGVCHTRKDGESKKAGDDGRHISSRACRNFNALDKGGICRCSQTSTILGRNQ